MPKVMPATMQYDKMLRFMDISKFHSLCPTARNSLIVPQTGARTGKHRSLLLGRPGGRVLDLDPCVQKQAQQFAVLACWNSPEQVLQVQPRVDSMPLASRDETRQYGGRITARFAAKNNQLARLCGHPHKRANWLQVGGDGGLKTVPVLLSVCASATRHCLNSRSYLRDVLDQLACRSTNADASEFLPDAWAIRQTQI